MLTLRGCNHVPNRQQRRKAAAQRRSSPDGVASAGGRNGSIWKYSTFSGAASSSSRISRQPLQTNNGAAGGVQLTGLVGHSFPLLTAATRMRRSGLTGWRHMQSLGLVAQPFCAHLASGSHSGPSSMMTSREAVGT